MSVVSSMPVNIGLGDVKNESNTPPGEPNIVCEPATEASESAIVTVHPLSPSDEVVSSVVFDPANSLQVCCAFVKSYMRLKMHEYCCVSKNVYYFCVSCGIEAFFLFFLLFSQSKAML